jgi:serine protease Do
MSSQDQKYDLPALGLGLSDLTPDLRRNYQIPEDETGALINEVDPSNAAADRGVRKGDVILSVNQQSVESASDARKAIEAAKDDGRKTVLLLIERNGSQSFIALPLDQG